jgi:hypothetical protein
LPAVTDSARAQRLAKIAVTRSREQLALRCRCNFKTYTWQVGDPVSVSLARYGFSAKPFRIIDRGFSVEGGMNFTLREEPNGIYDWNLGEASILTGAGNTTLPSPTVVGAPTITGVTSAQWLYKAGDGTFVARIRVAVTPPNDDYVTKGGKLQLQYKRGDWSSDWALIEADGAATQIWIDPAFDAQNYLIRVRAKNQMGYASAWTVPVVHTCQGRPGGIANLLLNSDWTQDLGYGSGSYADARALRHWTAAGNVAAFGRNYDGGKIYNIGAGGCWFYIPSNTVGHYAYVYQDVPIAVGVELEASVYVNIHRARALVAVQFLNAAKDTLLLQVNDERNTGTAVVGDAYRPLSNPRLWCKGTAPANTAYARFFCYVECTSSSSPYPFTAWSNALLCIAPSGVTRETATPWVDDTLNTIDGQLQKTYSQFVASTSVYVPLSQTRTLSSFVFTPEVSGSMLVDVSVGRIYHSGPSYAQVVGVLTVTQGASFTYQDCGRTQWNSAETEWSSSPKALLLVNVVAGVAVTLAFDIYGGGADVTVYGEQIRFSATVTRKTT